MASIKNGLHWYDTAGNTISAHGGGFLQKGEYFYWFGETVTVISLFPAIAL